MWNDITQTGYEFGMISRGVPIAGAQALGKTARPFKEDYKTKTRQEMGLLEESAAAFANSIPLMIGSIGLGGAAGVGARVAGTLPMFISGFQESGREAEELGITDPLDRLTFQTIGGTIEGASELIMPDASLIRPLRKRALKDLVRVGAKGLSKADAGRYVAEFTEKVAKEVGEEYAVEIGNVLRNASFAAVGYDKAAPEMKSARDYAVMTLSAALGAGTFAGVGTGVNAAFAKSTAIKKAAENPEAAAQAAADLVDAGKLTQEQADAFLAKVASVNRAVGKMPKDVDPDVAVNTADLLNEKVDLEESVKALEEEKNNVDPSFHQGIDDQIAQITSRINELTQQITGFQAPTEQIALEAPQMAPTEVSPEVGMEIPQEDQGVLQVINSVVQPISSDIEARMNNAEEIPMSEIEAVVDALIDAQQSVRSQEGARTRQTQGGFVTEFGALSDQQKRNFDTLIEQQINKLLNYEFATITTTEQAGEKTKTAGLVATPREGRPLPESVVSRDRFDGAGVRVGGRGAGRITVKRLPGFGGRSVYGVSFGNRKGVAPVEDLEFDNLEFVAPEILADGSFNARVKDSKSGLEFTITDPELSIDLAIAAQLKEAGRKEFPQPAFLEAVREVTQGQPTQVTTFPNLGRTGTTPAAVGVEPQTEQDVRQETNAPQEGRGQGEDAAPVPQEEGRQEGQVTPPAVAQEGETPPATAKKPRKTAEEKADEGKATLEKLKETLRALKAKPGGGANIDLTFGVVPITKAVWNTAIDTAILAIDAGQSIAQAVKAASDYISSKIDGDWGKAKFEQYMEERFGQAAPTQEIDDVAESAGISPKNFRDLYRVNRELFGLNQSEAMSAAIAMDKMIGVMSNRAGVSKTEMYGRLNFKKATEQEPPQGVKFQVDAWHGSPYQFDKFTTEKIGTGEGAQAFGWGLYFTDLEDIAKGYAKRLSGDVYSYDGKLISEEANNYLFLADDSLGENFNENTIKDVAKVAIDKIKKEYIPDLREIAKTSPSEKQRSEIPNEVKKLEGVIKELENVISSKEIKLEKNKALYKVSIHKGKTPDQYTWLEWDKPISPEVKEKILDFIEKDKKYGGDVAEGFVNTWKEAKRSIKYRLENNLYSGGQSLYEDIAETSGLSPKSASLFLLDAGIDGVRFPAESIARGATSDTARGFNYVVFDENAVSIEETIKFQEDAVKARGAMMITLDGQATIYALTDPNVSTPLHELAHVFEHYLTDEERTTVQDWAKTKDWTIKTSEAFARGFEKYLSEGQAPTPALQKIFDNFKQWLTDIYRGIVGSDIDVELNEPMRDLYAKMFEFTGEDGQSNFEKWKGDNNLLVGPDIQDAKTGEPIVVRAYHGTTNEFYEFDSSVKGSVEGHLGKINYFTSDYQDAAINYLSEGTDLTNRVEGRTEQIISELENNYDDYNESIPELSKKYGYTEEELEDDFVSFRSLARDLAKKELYGGTNKVLDVFIKLNNPVVLGKGSTWFQTLNISEADLDQAAQEIADENDISVEEAKQDYDFDIRDRAIENSGYENLAVDALSSALRSNGYRGASASEILGDNLYESEIDLNRLEGELRRNDKAGLYENEEGELASSQVVSDFLKNLGFDGIILTDVSSRFRGMGLGSSTSHIHVFDEFANQIKLADGSNTTFGETRDIRFQLDKAQPQQQAQPEAQVEATAKALEGLASDKFRLESGEETPTAINVDYGDISWPQSGLSSFNEGSDGKTYVTDKNGDIYQVSKTKLSANKTFLVTIKNTNGEEVGSFEFKRNSDGSFSSEESYTSKKGVGIATIAYDIASKDGEVIKPSKKLKKDGVRFWAKSISNAYHKAKADGSNPKLVQAVEDLLGQTAPEAKPAKTIAEQRKEFRETAKKYFDGLKKMGITFDPERNSKEDIAFLKALAKYIKLEIDAGMVTFKGFLEKTSNLIEGFNEKAVVAAAKEAWAKEVVKAYPKLYAKYSAAKRKELEKEIKDIRKTMIRRIMDMTDPKIVNLKSQLKTEKRRLSKEAAAQLAAIRNAYDAKTMMAMEPEDLMELMKLTEGIYKEGRSEIKALNESLDEAAQIQGEEMLAAIASKDKRLEKLDSKEAASKMLAKKAGVVVAVKGDDRVIMKEEKDLEALDGEGYTFLFLNTTSDKFVDLGFLDSVVSFFSGKLRTINENARDLRTALELIKSRSKESQDFINGLVAKMNKASVTKSRKSEEWSSILKKLRSDLFGPDIKFGYTNWMNAIAKVNGKPLKLINGRGVSIGPINNGKIVSLYRQIMDPTNLVKTDGVRKIDLSDESIQSIIDYMNLPGNLPGKEFALSLTNFFIKVAKDTKVVLENNGYNSTKLDEKRYNKEDFEGDDFIAKVMDQLAETRSEGFIPYTPIQATESPDNSQGVEIKEDDLLDSGDLQKNFSVISNNMITRRPGGVIVPTDIRQTLNAYTAGMANMNAKLPLLRETQSIFSNSNLKAMNNAFAPQFTENIKANYISFMTDRVTPVISNKTEAAMKTWLMTSTAIPMFLNFKSSILQMLASPNFMVSYDFSRYIDASKKLFGNADLFKDVFFEIINLPTIRQRFGGRFSPDSRIISEEMSRYGKVAVNIPFTNIRISAKELLSKGYVFSSIGDVVSIAIGGAPIYYDITQTNKKKYVAEGMSALEAETKAKQDAEERLFEIIQETQQSSEAMYLSEFQKQSFTRIFSSFATATMQYYRKARRAATRMKNKEGNQLQNAYEILHYTVINAAVFQFFSSMLIDAVSGPGEDELEEMSRQERMDFVRYMEDVMATVAQGTGGMGVALQAIILGLKESQKSGKPEKIAESALRTMPAVRMKYDAAINAMREWKRGDYVRSLTKGAELANIPADRIRSLGLQVSDALAENLDAQERIARLIGFRTESWMREKKQGEIWNGVQSTIDKSTPAERQRAISNTKSAYRDLFQLYGKRYAEATTEAEKARVDSIASKELLNVYNHRQGGPEFTKELQKLFNQSFEFNSLPKDMQELKNMESNRKIGDIVDEVLSLEKKSEQKAMEYWSSLVNNGIISKNEIERIREEYNTRKGLQ